MCNRIKCNLKKKGMIKKMAQKVKRTSNFANKPFDFILCITVMLLLALGLVMVLSASSPSALAETGDDSYTYFRKQGIFAIVGVFAMLFISKIDYRFYKKFYKLAYIASVILLLAVMLVGRDAGGAKRWINLGLFSFQPSEAVKILLIIFYAAILTKNKDKLQSFSKGFVYHLALLIPIIGLLLAQPHLSASIIIIGIVAIMMIMAGCKLKHFILSGATVGVPALAALIAFEPYRLKRFVSFLDPWADAKDTGWQIIQSLYAIGSGGLFGVGLGESKQKFLYISEPHNDFIFAVLAEELGFIGCLVVIILFAIFIWRGILVAMRAPDMFGSLIAIGITSLVGLQAIINIAVVTSSMPVTGMPLPFFSYGGTALLMLLCGVRNIVKYIESKLKSLKGMVRK